MTDVHAPVPLSDPSETDAFAARLAPLLRPGDVVLLEGPIGAGKTHLARALLRSLGVTEDIPSPTFTLVQIYSVPGFDAWHADLYRLTGPDDVLELGLAEAFEAALCLVEWPDRLGATRPKQALTLQISLEGEGRLLRFASPDATWQQRLADV